MTTCSTNVCGTVGWTGPLPGDPDNSSVLTATSEFGGINLKWTMPASNAHAVAFTKIYRGVSGDVTLAAVIGTQSGSSYFDADSASSPTTTYYYWIQHVSINGTVLGYVGPASAKAKPEIDKIIQLLAGKVETSALAQSLRDRIDIITNLEGGITSLNNRLEYENRLITETLDAVKNDVSGATAYIQNQMDLFADEKVALATAVNTQVSMFSEGVYAAIREETNTRAEETGALFGEKLVKIDLAGNVSGYGLSAYVDPDGTSMSEFRVAADRFSVGAPAVVRVTAPSNPYHGMVWVNDTDPIKPVTYWYNKPEGVIRGAWQTTPVNGISPFIVKTSPETLDGITIPAGVYINSAVISRLSATQIDTRGLTIKNANGEVIFGAGTALDFETGVGGEGKPQVGATRNVFKGIWKSGTDYVVGDMVIDSIGNGWSALVNHTASVENDPPEYPGQSSTYYWSLYAAKGEDGVVVALTNEFAGVSCDYAGNYAQAQLDSAAAGTMVLYEGVLKVAPSRVVFSVAEQSGCVGSISTSGDYTVSQLTADDAYLLLKAVYKDETYEKKFTLQKVKAGKPSSSYVITLSDNSVVRDPSGTYAKTAVTVSAKKLNESDAFAEYMGRILVKKTNDGETYEDLYFSSVDESECTFTLPAGMKEARCILFGSGVTDVYNSVPLDSTTLQILDDATIYTVYIQSSNGTIFRRGEARQTRLTARVFRNGKEITDEIPNSGFKWIRKSMVPQPSPNDDAMWNYNHSSGHKSIDVDVDDVYARATFSCDVFI